MQQPACLQRGEPQESSGAHRQGDGRPRAASAENGAEFAAPWGWWWSADVASLGHRTGRDAPGTSCDLCESSPPLAYGEKCFPDTASSGRPIESWRCTVCEGAGTMIIPGNRSGNNAGGHSANQADDLGNSDSANRSFSPRAVATPKVPPPTQYADRIDDTLNDSFPASDPPSWMGR